MEISDFYWFANRNHRESRDGSHAVGVGGEHILALGIGGTATVVAKGTGVGDEQCKKERENKGIGAEAIGSPRKGGRPPTPITVRWLISLEWGGQSASPRAENSLRGTGAAGGQPFSVCM